MKFSLQFWICNGINMVLAIVLLTFVLLAAGCTTTKYVPVIPELPKAKLPKECRTGSPRWSPLPAGPAKKTTVAKLWIDNRNKYTQLRFKHAICRKFAAQNAMPEKKAKPTPKPLISWWGS